MKYLLRLIYLLVLLILPFIILIRLSVFMHQRYGWNGWLALGVGASLTAVLMLIYFSLMYSKLTGKFGSWLAFKRRAYAAGFLVFVFIAYSLFFVSGENVKNRSIRTEYLELHPILRMSVSTIILIDRNLLITDASRLPEDYDTMGLPRNERSLHFRQADGFTYALDVRTKERHELINKSVEIYFTLMGFKTLRHVGTADHLHISLAPNF